MTRGRPKELPNRRRCHSAPPWSLSDVTRGFYRRPHATESLYIDPRMLQRYKTVEIWVELPLSTLILADGRFVFKMVPITWDVDTIVHHMRVAGSVIRVPRVYAWGRSGNSCYMVMDYIPGYCFSSIVDKYGYFAAVRLKREISSIVDRLAAIGLSHGDFHPRNVIVDSYYNVASVLDWDHAARIESAGDEYLRRVTSRYAPFPWFPPHSEGDESWDCCFLRHASDRGSARYWPNEFRDARVPAASAPWLRRWEPRLSTLLSAEPPTARTVSRDRRRQIALLVSGPNEMWNYFLAALKSNSSCNICLIVTDDRRHLAALSSVSGDVPCHLMNPAQHIPKRRVSVHTKGPPASFDADLAEAVAEVRSHVVVLCDWPHELGETFWAMAAVPPVLSALEIPLAVLRLAESSSSISLSSISGSAPPSTLFEHFFSPEETQSSTALMQCRRTISAEAAVRVGKPLRTQVR